MLRFHYHKPKEIWENLRDLSLPRTTFSSQLTEAPSVKQFITEDEIDVAMTRGSGLAGGKGRVFTFFQEPHTDKEKVDSEHSGMKKPSKPPLAENCTAKFLAKYLWWMP